jgi:hypothetical protein
MKQKVIVHTAKKALEHLDKMRTFHNDMLSRFNVNKPDGNEPTNEMTLEQHMMANGLPPTLAGKIALARGMGMKHYNGSKEHDISLLNSSINKGARKEVEESKKSEQGHKDKEHSLKEKELSIKEKESESKKVPNSDEIADSLLKKFNQ